MRCRTCGRVLVRRTAWTAKPLAERRRLSKTHAVAGARGLCGTCKTREHERDDAGLAYDGGWWRDDRGILRPIVTGGAE